MALLFIILNVVKRSEDYNIYTRNIHVVYTECNEVILLPLPLPKVNS